MDSGTFSPMAIQRGEPVDGGGFNTNVHSMAEIFDLAKMRGKPILVSRTPNSPLYLVEGYTRLTALLQPNRPCHLTGDTVIPITLGVTEQLASWQPWY